MEASASPGEQIVGACRLVGYERRMQDTGEVIVRPNRRGFAVGMSFGQRGIGDVVAAASITAMQSRVSFADSGRSVRRVIW
jgi:hypothetical protein